MVSLCFGEKNLAERMSQHVSLGANFMKSRKSRNVLKKSSKCFCIREYVRHIGVWAYGGLICMYCDMAAEAMGVCIYILTQLGYACILT